jgi:hypothetical protein
MVLVMQPEEVVFSGFLFFYDYVNKIFEPLNDLFRSVCNSYSLTGNFSNKSSKGEKTVKVDLGESQTSNFKWII